MLSLSDWFFTILLLAFVGLLMSVDKIPNRQQLDATAWVKDFRNGCEPRTTIALSNDGVTKDSKFIPKLLTVYDCKNGLTAAVIEKQ